MRTRSHSKAFRNAILWTWWFPLFLAVVAGGLRYSFDKDLPEEWVAVGKVALALPGGQSPDEATIQEHLFLLESASLKQATGADRSLLPELQSLSGEVRARHINGGVMAVTASGPDPEQAQVLLNGVMDAYVLRVETLRQDPSPAGAALNRDAVPSILEQAGTAVEKGKELWLTAILTAVAGGAGGIVITLLLCSLWAFFRPTDTQPSLDEIMKAAAGLDSTSRSVLAEWLRAGEKQQDAR